jgi:hypothetical protein
LANDDSTLVCGQLLLGEDFDDRRRRGAAPEFFVVVPRGVGIEAIEDLRVAAAAGGIDRSGPLVFVLVVGRAPAKVGHRSMGVGSSPQAEHDPLLVPLPRVMGESNVQLELDLRLVRKVALRVAEEGLVARVVGEAVAQRMSQSEVDAQSAESLVEPGVVRVAEDVGAHLMRVGAPFQEEIEKVLARKSERHVQRAFRLGRLVITVGEQQDKQSMVLPFAGDL